MFRYSVLLSVFLIFISCEESEKTEWLVSRTSDGKVTYGEWEHVNYISLLTGSFSEFSLPAEYNVDYGYLEKGLEEALKKSVKEQRLEKVDDYNFQLAWQEDVQKQVNDISQLNTLKYYAQIVRRRVNDEEVFECKSVELNVTLKNKIVRSYYEYRYHAVPDNKHNNQKFLEASDLPKFLELEVMSTKQ